MYVGGVLFFGIAYGSILVEEERYLRARFGAQYDEYCRRVPRFVPRVRGLLGTIRAQPFGWRRLVRKEYGSTFTWTTTALALLAWERFRSPAYSPRQGDYSVLAATWVAILACYLLARVLKKTGRLGHGLE
jgi:hypothetical protein